MPRSHASTSLKAILECPGYPTSAVARPKLNKLLFSSPLPCYQNKATGKAFLVLLLPFGGVQKACHEQLEKASVSEAT